MSCHPSCQHEPIPEWDMSVEELAEALGHTRPPKGATLLQEADAIINGERQKNYGPPAESFGRIARLWSDYLDQTVTTLDVVNLMILLKVSRAKTGGFHRDSFLDVAGYAGCAELLEEK